MPLLHGHKAKSKKGKSENIRRLIDEGYSQRQAVAIAFSLAGQSRTKRRKRR